MSQVAKQIFFSHTWRNDKMNRDTHQRVLLLVRGLQKLGWGTWIDEDDMLGNIDAAMAQGIDNCECVLVCITEEYCNKVNNAANNPNIRDNCHKEWNYAHIRDKLMIPIIMEKHLLNIHHWPAGVVPLHLASQLYIDASSDELESSVKQIHKRLLRHKLLPKFARRPVLRRKLSRSYSLDSFRRICGMKTKPRSNSIQSVIHI
jgi:hypothetical protein